MTDIIVNDQIWTADNLDVSHYRNGDVIPEVQEPEEWESLKTGAYCFFDNQPLGQAGKLYNWYAVSDPRGLAPVGYRIPNHYDWLKLRPHYESLFQNEKLGGCRLGGNYMYGNEGVGWWASSDILANDHRMRAPAHWIYKDDPQLGWKPFQKSDGFYVRCLKETYQSVKIIFDDNLAIGAKSVTIKCYASTNLQNLLDYIFLNFLKHRVNPNSYGREWFMAVYDGERLETIMKKSAKDERKFNEILYPYLLELLEQIEFVVTKNRV